jgi:hypothetical protein
MDFGINTVSGSHSMLCSSSIQPRHAGDSTTHALFFKTARSVWLSSTSDDPKQEVDVRLANQHG